jgi:hypothetical protein
MAMVTRGIALAGWLASGILVITTAIAQVPQDTATPPVNPAAQAAKPALAKPAVAQPAATKPAVTKAAATKPAVAAAPTKYLPNRFAGRAGVYYKAIWGVDSLSVKMVESGEIIRFAWRVLDADRAKMLSDNKAEPALIDSRAGVSLVVPTMEQIGQLRQSGPPEAGKSYWMAFSNKGRLVRRGDRVDVVIGTFRADGLMVD